MLFTQPAFLFVFLPALLALYFLVVAMATKEAGHGDLIAANALLVLASFVFYAQGAGRYIWLLCGSIAFNWWVADAIDRAHARAAGPSSNLAKTLLVCGVTVNVLVLAVFKYVNFFAGNFGTLSLALGKQPIGTGVLLPLGMSFLTLHAISYLVDAYRRDDHSRRRPLDAALYLAFFPPLIAGPIVRYRDFAHQISERVVGVGNFVYGVRRVVIGLCKKLLIADVVGVMADRVFDMPADLPRRRHGVVRSHLLHVADVLCAVGLLGHGDRARPDVRIPSARRTSAGRTSPKRCRSSGAAG